MPSNTTYNPPNIDSFVKTCLIFNAQGVSTTITAGQSANLAYTLTDDCLITGVELIVNNGNYGDTVNFQILEGSTVIDQYATNWCVAPTCDIQFDLTYPAKILAGLTLQVVYNSTGTSNVFVAINYKLHKCLV